MKTILIYFLLAYTGSILCCAILDIILLVLGFGAGGILAKSCASTWHSAIGIVAKRSWIAILQSWGATGIMIPLLFNSVGLAILVAVMTITASIYYFCYYEGDFSAANIATFIGASFENVKTEISNANITARIPPLDGDANLTLGALTLAMNHAEKQS